MPDCFAHMSGCPEITSYMFSSSTHRSLTCLSTLQRFTDALLQHGPEGQEKTITNSTIHQSSANLSLCGYTHLLCTSKRF
ncbi:hypothetical protein ILYODFUR_033237 [Ilyodon furcidens]|uniref:Uncharacterized protein n=1 Tax=Ilyodon furcidens TaxID=33524 RepID=A0ABV0TD36_9TELE